ASSHTISTIRPRSAWPSSRRRTASTRSSGPRHCRGSSCSSTGATRWRPRHGPMPGWGMSASAAEAGESDTPAAPVPRVGLAAGRGVCVVLPTYNERENIEAMVAAVLEQLPEASVLVVDDDSPDGAGELADTMAAREPRVSVLHRPGKEGL